MYSYEESNYLQKSIILSNNEKLTKLNFSHKNYEFYQFININLYHYA